MEFPVFDKEREMCAIRPSKTLRERIRQRESSTSSVRSRRRLEYKATRRAILFQREQEELARNGGADDLLAAADQLRVAVDEEDVDATIEALNELGMQLAVEDALVAPVQTEEMSDLLVTISSNIDCRSSLLFVLANITCGPVRWKVSFEPMFDLLLEGLEDEDDETAARCFSIFANLAAGAPPFMPKLWKRGLFDIAAQALCERSLWVAKGAAWLLSNLARGMAKSEIGIFFDDRLIFHYAELLDGEEPVVLEVAGLLCFLTTHCTEQQLIDLFNANVLEGVTHLVHHPHVMAKQMLLQLCGNFSSGDDSWTIRLLELGLLDVVIELFGSPVVFVRKEAAWVLSNVFACSGKTVVVVISQKPSIISTLFISSPSTPEVKFEVSHAFDAASMHGCCLPLLVTNPSVLAAFLKTMLQSMSAITVGKTLSGLRRILTFEPSLSEILELEGISDILQRLMGNDDSIIRGLAEEIYDIHFVQFDI